ncbi:hypothetical protein EsH8_IX_001056 [Colletotrichum jinshuiense]
MEWSTSSIPTFRQTPITSTDHSTLESQNEATNVHTSPQSSRCPHFAGFLSVCLATENDLGLHPFVTNVLPDFQDVTLGGGSFDVRQVKSSSFPTGLGVDILKGRDYVVVKHPRANVEGWGYDTNSFADAATELQILRHPPLKRHENIIKLLAVMYHDTKEDTTTGLRILPALVLEYAEYGSLKAYQEAGGGQSFSDQIQIAMDTAKGLKALHDCGVIHGDVKPSNLLVCKHPTKMFIVKLCDFGFSISLEDISPIGHSQRFCAPESYEGILQRGYVKQVDIYGYGLTLLSIFESGSYFYDSLPVENLDENMRKAKKSNFISTLIPIRVLMSRSNNGLPLFILCKIWVHCLQASPADRFRDMDRIMLLLDILQHTTGSSQSHTASEFDIDKLQRSFAAIQTMKDGAETGNTHTSTPPEDSITATCIGFAQELMEGLPLGQETIQMSPIALKEFRDKFAKVVQMSLWLHKSMVVSQQLPLGEQLHDLIQTRAIAKLFEVCGRPDEATDHNDLSIKKILSFLVDLMGLLPEPQPSQNQSQVSDIEATSYSHLHFSRHLDFIPDLQEYSAVIRKMPWLVQVDATKSLKAVFGRTEETSIKAAASFSLSQAYVNGVGVDFNLAIARDYLLEAAKLGHKKAQLLFIRIFASSKPSAQELDADIWTEWLVHSAEAGNPTALNNLESSSPVLWRHIVKKNQITELEEAGFSESELELVLTNPDKVAGAVSASKKLHWAIIEDRRDVMDTIILEHPEMLKEALNCRNENPLLLACRLSRTSMVKSILKICPDIAYADNSNISPLHWLFKFPVEDIDAVARSVCQKGADINTLAVAIVRDGNIIKPTAASEPRTWTPLHWAILANSLTAVDALLKNGADPLFRAGCEVGESIPTNPLQLACMLCHSSIVSRILQEPAASEALSKATPMVLGKPVETLPLFCPLKGFSRWARLTFIGEGFEEEMNKTIATLVKNGAPTDVVLKVGTVKMPAVYAVAFHQCPADVMISGLQYGFENEIDVFFDKDNALLMAINHGDQAMVRALLDAGADTTVVDGIGCGVLERAAKESDDVFFVRSILETGVPVNDCNPGQASAFETAVYCGNLTVARYLFDHGADRDRVNDLQRTTLGQMIHLQTRNAVERIKFILSLPDREESDGFTVFYEPKGQLSALHYTIFHMSESGLFGKQDEIGDIVLAQLLEKYDSEHHLNAGRESDGMTPLAMAVEVGAHRLAKRLLEKGASIQARDKFGRTPLDIAQERYCQPEKTPLMTKLLSVNSDAHAFEKQLRMVNENTVELVNLLVSYGTADDNCEISSWFRGEAGFVTMESIVLKATETETMKDETDIRDADVNRSLGNLILTDAAGPGNLEHLSI